MRKICLSVQFLKFLQKKKILILNYYLSRLTKAAKYISASNKSIYNNL